MPRPKFVKPLVLGVACTIPFGLVIGLSINWNHTTFISAVGSSGAKPFVESFGKQYHKSFSKFDVTVESGGTTFAVEELTKGYTNIGNASCNPYPIVNNGFLNKWNNKKTFTLGWEGLVLMYSLPKGLDKPDDVKILITEDNILDLYAVFSGYLEDPDGTKWPKDTLKDTLYNFLDPSSLEVLPTKDQNILKTTKILPFVRAGGNTGANSSIAFSYYSNLANFEDMSERQKKAFKFGQYGHDGLTIMQTDESNARAYQSFDYKKQPGSMVYLTSSFLSNNNNIKEMKKKGYRFAGYQPKGTSVKQYIDLNDLRSFFNTICTVDGYNWYRPINVMIDLGLAKAKDFIYWMYMDTHEDVPIDDNFKLSENYINTIYGKGTKPLSVNQFKSMLGSETPVESLKNLLFDISSSDKELSSSRGEAWAEVYGALDGALN